MTAPKETQAPIAGHILVVDDNEDNREVLSRHLIRQGYQVSTAENGFRAIDMVAAGSFDVVLLDIMMPELDGFQVLQKWKDDQTLVRLPVIVISALDDLESVARCIEIGAEDYLPKPFNKTLLRARVHACLEKKKLRDREMLFYRAIEKNEKHLAGELADAASYVISLLPTPMKGGIRAEWQFIPSTQLGGDSFGYHWVDEQHLAIYLLDVAGHGVGPALLSITVMNVLRSQALLDTDFQDPAQVLSALNKMFPRTKYNKHFSIWYGVYETSSRELHYAGGGHPPAVLATGSENGDRQLQMLETRGLLIGLVPGAKFPSNRCVLEPSTSLYIYSDGIYEITKMDGEIMELEEFLEILKLPPEAGASDIDRILSRVREMNAFDSFPDDVSILKITF